MIVSCAIFDKASSVRLACTDVWFSKIIGGADANEIDRRSMNCIWTAHAKNVWVLPEIIWHYCCLSDSFLNLVLWIISFAFQFIWWIYFAMESSGLHYCLFVKVQMRKDFLDLQIAQINKIYVSHRNMLRIFPIDLSCCFSAATLISYHSWFTLSTTLLIFFSTGKL